MEPTLKMALILGLSIFTFLLNLPFGYFRARAKKYSFKWFLYIHVPIPFVFLARVSSHLDYRFIPIFLIAAVLGQVSGGKIHF